MSHPSEINRSSHRVRRPLRGVVPLVLLLALGLFAAACTDDATDATDTTDSTEAGDTTDVTEPGSDESDQTAQTLDDAAPAEAQEPVEDDTAMLEAGLALDPNGLTILDPAATTTELLAFGDDQAAVIAGLEAVLGSADEMNEGTSECPNGQAAVATWDDTLMVDFDATEQFLSWVLLPGSDLTTIEDVGIGSPVAALDGVEFFADSTLGDEFNAGGFGGLANGTGDDASIDRLWAGEICSFR
ncbi:MAG: hypothetical protein OEZ14_11960 [Acidimicrobiia bacterium]|nr:hypothetical protein [Acidimicrobiia bacterium]